MSLLASLFVGLIVGLIARALVSGKHRLGCFGTSGLGIVGSLVGGTLMNLLTGDGLKLATSGFLGSILGAVLLLVAVRKMSGKSTRQNHQPYQ